VRPKENLASFDASVTSTASLLSMLRRRNFAMDELTEHLKSSAEDGFWEQIQSEARREAEREPLLVSFLFASVLRHRTLEDALGVILANKLQTPDLPAILVRDLINEALVEDMSIRASIRADLLAARTRDPAAHGYAQPFLYYKGFHALQAYRVAHRLLEQGRQALAAHLQNRISEAFGVDVHPAARIGSGVLIDHGTSVVIGETAVVEDYVSLLHEVTLGGTGKETGDRHPKVRRGVLIGAGAKILGNIEIGRGAKVGAGSVVLRDVPPHTTVAGVPARVVGRCTVAEPALEMDSTFPIVVESGGGI
jgi:serine O-acetyltransferase